METKDYRTDDKTYLIYLPCKHREDWSLDDPTGKSDEEFKKIITTIETKIKELKERIESGKF